ncbi:DUF1697 domain-containing protein [Luteococcus sp. Sow4_B9]|uniref:DUF1697 domain-containing protein n=1 Tax=Luteococcus sp. Sow4_B9 TaxID=3438792 RepID=UPI003F9B5984
MSARVALLRGINLGRSHRVAMAELRELATELGFTDVSTHLQSGNLIYRCASTVGADQQLLASSLTERFGFEIPVVVVEGSRLPALLDANPFPDGDPKSVHLGFSPAALTSSLSDELKPLARDWERFEVRDGILFADFGGRVHDSRAAKALTRLVRPSFITLRNLATMRAVADKAA